MKNIRWLRGSALVFDLVEGETGDCQIGEK